MSFYLCMLKIPKNRSILTKKQHLEKIFATSKTIPIFYSLGIRVRTIDFIARNIGGEDTLDFSLIRHEQQRSDNG